MSCRLNLYFQFQNDIYHECKYLLRLSLWNCKTTSMPEQVPTIFDHTESFKILFEYATIGIVVVDKKGIIKLANPFAEKLFGYDREELKGQKLDALIPNEVKEIHAGHHQAYFKYPKERIMGFGMDLFAKRKDGSLFPVEISIGHFETAGETFAVTYIADISLRKANEEAIKKSEEKYRNELYQLNKGLESRVAERTEALAEAIDELAASKEELLDALEKEKELSELKSRFVTTASHEFRTPLAAILSSSSLIEAYMEKQEPEKTKKHLKRIQSSVNNLIEILNDFLSIGKLEEGIIKSKPSALQLDEFVNTILLENGTLLKNGQHINYIHLDGNPGVEVDAQILKNIILNLFSNAIKYSNEGKNIDITTSVRDNLIELKVKDYGIGIPDKDQRFLFSRFFRAKNAINIDGTGLGLHIVKKYVQLLKGSISFSSELEEGSEFVVHIPVNV